MNKEEEKLCKLFFECKRERERETEVNRQARKKRSL